MIELGKIFKTNAATEIYNYRSAYDAEFLDIYESKLNIRKLELAGGFMCAFTSAITGSAAAAKTNWNLPITACVMASTALITAYPFIKEIRKHRAFLRIHAHNEINQKSHISLTPN